MKRRTKLMALTLCLLLLLSAGAVFADSAGPAENEPDSITDGSISFVRHAGLTGKSGAFCESNVVATYLRAEYQLQKLVGKTYVDEGSPVNAYQYNTSIFSETRYWDVEESGTYRVKVRFYERYNNATRSYGPLYSAAAAL